MTRRFAAGGFRDMTRIAESEPGMWTSILLLSNPQAILERIADTTKSAWTRSKLKPFKQITKRPFGHFSMRTQAPKECRSISVLKRDGAYDLFIDVPDQEGVILEILKILQGFPWLIFTSMKRIVKISHGILQLTQL